VAPPPPVTGSAPLPRFDRGARRIVLGGLTTLSALVLLFSYRTSTSADAPPETDASSATADLGSTTESVAPAPAASSDPVDDGYGSAPAPAAVPAPRSAPAARSTVPAAPAGAPPAGSAAGRAGAGRGWSGTVTGPVVQVKWGQVQARATLQNGRITAVDVPLTPSDNAHDRQVNAAAVPVLVRETLAAQSTRIDMVSGATFTSNGYVQSLQAALDQVGAA
jgi:uncharacterized protein with FMN-binding domain